MSSVIRLRVLAPAVMLVLVAACGGSTPVPSAAAPSSSVAPSASGARPPSPAVVTIQQPAANQTVTGPTVHIQLALQNATIVSATTTTITPDTGHVHLYVDNVVVSMNYGLTQDLTLKPGTYQLKAEFVAADHAPFSPRVWSSTILFVVK